MTALFFGGELDSFTAFGDVLENTTAGTFDSTYARCSIHLNAQTAYADSIKFSSASDFWFHGSAMIGTLTAGQILGLVNSAGVEVFRITVSGSAAACVMQMEYLLNGVWSAVGATSTQDLSTRKIIDLRVAVNANGSAVLYIGGVAVVTSSATNLAGLADIAQIRLRSPGVMYWSEIVGATLSTVGKRVITRYPSGDGSDTAWAGTFADVDDTAYSTTDYVEASSGNLVETFACSGGSATNTTVDAVAVSARAICGASGPNRLHLCVRHNGINYLSELATLTDIDTPRQVIWPLNPETLTAWQSVQIANLQPGLKSLAVPTTPIAPTYGEWLALPDERDITGTALNAPNVN